VTAAASPDECFAALTSSLGRRTGVSTGRMFGSDGLKVANKVFAMLVKERLVVKLPQARVEALIAEGAGERFDPGHGRLMKEWVVVKPNAEVDWRSLATEALQYVRAGR
jgi:TfoX/Sxy family transcriptional regulator of competence genes